MVGDDGVLAVALNPPGNMAELSALVNTALERTGAAQQEPLTSEQALPLLRGQFRSVQQIRFDDELVVTNPDDLTAYLLSLPFAEADGAGEQLAREVERRFAQSRDQFRIRKAVDLLICRS